MFKFNWDSYRINKNDVIVQYGLLKSNFQLHSHDFTELVIVLGGKGHHIIEKKKYPLQKGDIYVITEDMVHGYEICERLELINILFNPKEVLIEEIRQGLTGYRAMFEIEPLYRFEKDFSAKHTLDILNLKEIVHLCDEIRPLSEIHIDENRILVKTLLNVLIAKLSTLYINQNEPKPKQLVMLSEVIDYIESHLSEDIDTPTLSKKAGFSTRHFNRLFKDIFGVTPKQYIMSLRLIEACKLLKESDMTISQLSAQCGFPDSSYFAQLFLKRFQITPTEYRKDSGKKQKTIESSR